MHHSATKAVKGKTWPAWHAGAAIVIEPLERHSTEYVAQKSTFSHFRQIFFSSYLLHWSCTRTTGHACPLHCNEFRTEIKILKKAADCAAAYLKPNLTRHVISSAVDRAEQDTEGKWLGSVSITLTMEGSVNASFRMYISLRSSKVSMMKSSSLVEICIRQVRPRKLL